MSFTASPFLRRVLLADGAVTAAGGFLMLLVAGGLEKTLGVPAAMLRYIAVSLVLFAALVVRLATRESVPRAGVWAVIALNSAWAAGTALLALSGWVAPTGPGYGFILGQAVLTAIVADLEYFGLRRSVAQAV
jgi:hypothetical protein